MENKETFVPVEDIADHFSVSIITIRSWVRKGYISRNAYVKVGATYRYKLSDVINSLLSNGAMVNPTEEGANVNVPAYQQQAKDMVASHMERKEMEDLFDEDM